MARVACGIVALARVLSTADAFVPGPSIRALRPVQLGARLSMSRHDGASDDGHFFKLTKGLMEFGARDEVELVVYEEHDYMHRYITQSPERVILSTWDSDLVDRKEQNVFRLTTRPVQFVSLNLQPCIELMVWPEDEQLHIKSIDCSILGVEHVLGKKFADSLKVEVTGRLKAVPEVRGNNNRAAVRLVGEVVFFTSGQLPFLLAMTPRPVLESAASTVNKRIMSYAKTRFINNLAEDFERWMAVNTPRSKLPV